MKFTFKLFVVALLVFLALPLALAQRGGEAAPEAATPRPAQPVATDEALSVPVARDIDYEMFYRYVPEDKFQAAREESTAPEAKTFEFMKLEYPQGDKNPKTYRFDMGPADAPVKAGYTKVTKDDVFTWEKGWGWSVEPAADDFVYAGSASLPIQKGRDYGVVQNQYLRQVFAKHGKPCDIPPIRMTVDQDTYTFYDTYLDDMSRDSVLNAEELAFKVALPNGRYMVSMVVGDLQIPRYGMDIYANGYLVASNLFTGLIQFRGYSEPASPWVVRVTFPVNVVRNNLRIALRASDNIFKERVEVEAETPDYNFSQLPFVMARGEKRLSKFLGKRMAAHGPATQMAIAGIMIAPFEDYPLSLVRQKLFPARFVSDQAALSGVEKFNAGDFKGAEKDFARIPDEEYMLKAMAYLALAGRLEAPLDEESRLVDEAIKLLEKSLTAGPGDILAEDLLQSIRLYRGGLYNLEHAAEMNLSNARAQAGALFNWIGPNDILYPKSLVHYGYSFASIDPHRWATAWQIAEEAYLKLQEVEPGNRYSRYYLYWDPEGWDFKNYDRDIEGAPKWAVMMREAYNRLLDQAEWWGQNRQLPDGRLGGGWGDDVEIGVVWEIMMLVNPDASKLAMDTTRAIADGVWWSGDIDRDTGFFDGIADVEHTAEWTGDSQAVMVGIDYGSPTYFERNLKIAKLMRDLWMGRTQLGHLHFKSMVLGNKAIGKTYGGVHDAEIDHPLNGRAVYPAYWDWWYSPVGQLNGLMTDWANAWWDDCKRAENGKPEWVIPGPIGFPTDVLGGNKATDWRRGSPKTNTYENPTYAGYIMDLFARIYWKTGDEKWLKPKAAVLSGTEVLEDRFNTMPEHVADLKVENKYEKLSKVGLESILKIIRMSWPSVTSEVASTDRIAMPGLNEILGLLTGGNLGGGLGFVPMTFEKTSRNVAFMVLTSSEKEAKVILYNFNPDPEPVHMKLWRLWVDAEHDVTLGIDANDDDQIDQIITTFPYKHVHRGDSISFQIPARKAVVVDVEQTKPGTGTPGRMADLALAPEDVRYEEGKLSVSIHNIGNLNCGPFTVNVWQGEAKTGKRIGSFSVAALEAPDDLGPRLVTKSVDWSLPAGATLENPAKITVEVDPEDKYYEITEANNLVSRSFPYETKAYMVPRMWGSLAAKYGLKRGDPFPADFPKDEVR